MYPLFLLFEWIHFYLFYSTPDREKPVGDDERNGHATWQQSIESQLQLQCDEVLHRYLVPVFVTAVTDIPLVTTKADPKGDRPNMAESLT